MRARAALACKVALAVVALGATGADAAARHFTFRDAEFMHPDEAAQAVQAFLSDRLPAGLPVAQARRRLVEAGMTCRMRGAPFCTYAMPTHADGGVIGEDAWTVRMVLDDRGALLRWTVDHDQPSTHP